MSRLGVLTLAALLSSTYAHPATMWRTSNMLLAREGQSAAVAGPHELLIDGGTVPGGLFGTVSQSAEIFDSATNRWRFVAPMSVSREGQVTVSLGHGDVLVAGGEDDSLQPQDSVQVFSLGTGRWKDMASLPSRASQQSAVRLSDGDVLVTGGIVKGRVSRRTWLFDLRRDRWLRLADMHDARAEHASILLSRDRVLVASGSSPRAEIYHVRQNRWTAAGSPGSRLSAAVLDLSGDRVLIAGGSTLGGVCLRSALLFSEGGWTSIPNMSQSRCSPLAAALGDGTALVGGGYDANTSRTVQRFAPATHRWLPFPAFHIVRAAGTLNVVGGELVAVGGNAEGSPVSISETYPVAALRPPGVRGPLPASPRIRQAQSLEHVETPE